MYLAISSINAPYGNLELNISNDEGMTFIAIINRADAEVLMDILVDYLYENDK